MEHGVWIEGGFNSGQIAVHNRLANDFKEVLAVLFVAFQNGGDDLLLVNHFAHHVNAAELLDQSTKAPVVLADQNAENRLKGNDLKDIFQRDQIALHIQQSGQLFLEFIGSERPEQIGKRVGGYGYGNLPFFHSARPIRVRARR